MSRDLLVIPLLLLISWNAGAQSISHNPKAHPDAMVVCSDVRFTLLTPQMIRMEWSADGHFEERASFIFLNRHLPVPHYTKEEHDGWIIITTEKLTLRYRLASGKFSKENLNISFRLDTMAGTWYPGMMDSLNLKGTTRTLDQTNGEKDVELEQGLISRSGWSVVDDSKSLLFDGSEWNWVTNRPEGERQDLYFFGYGHEYKQALYDFTLVAGKIPMPPRYAFGYWWSRYWTYSDPELRRLVMDMKTYDVPIDVLIIDMDWHKTWGLTANNPKRDPFGESIGWTGYTWNRSLFPDPGGFLQWTRDQHLKTALNLHPASGIAPMEEKYADFAGAYGFDTTNHPYIPFAMENKKWAQVYFDVLLRPLEKQGIDFWWLDWQAWLESKTLKGLSNTWWLNYTFFTNAERLGTTRPLLFHRWGGLGNHRYQIGFSGDTWISWESLAFQPYFTSTAGNVGYGYWSHDIGGHMYRDPSSELYLRWLQWGIFSPIVRTHSTKSTTIERRIWKYADTFEMMRDALHFRYALAPYIYTASREAYDSGISICRPMYYDYPEKQKAYDFKSQYMFGDEMLVAPITEEASTLSGLAAQKIWLPEGEWYEWYSGTGVKGGAVVERTYALDEVPLFIKSGAVIPMYPQRNNLQQQIDTLVLTLIPGGNGETRVYEDDGISSKYKKNHYTFTRVMKNVLSDGSIHLTVFPREGSFDEMAKSRSYEIRLLCTFPPSEVSVNGKSYAYASYEKPERWTYDALHLTTYALTPKIECDKKIEVIVDFSPQHKENKELLNGKIGLFGRLPKIIAMMKDEVNRHDPFANAPDLVLRAGNLPTRINYAPEQTMKLLADFEQSSYSLLRQITDYPGGNSEVLRAIVSLIPDAPRMLSMPEIKIGKATSTEPAQVEIVLAEPGAEIRYTLDGSMPVESSSLYSIPFTLDTTATVRARAFKAGLLPSEPSVVPFNRIWAKSVRYDNPPSTRYTGGSEYALVNGKLGTAENYKEDWIGFEQEDLSATIELLRPQTLHSITTRFLQIQNAWIFLPTHVRYEVSSDGVQFQSVFESESRAESERQSENNEVKEYTATVNSTNVKFLRVRAKNLGVCPAWHTGVGGKAWLFVDEVKVE